MKVFVGSMMSAAVLLAGVAHGQVLPPMHGEAAAVVRASDVGGSYAAAPAYGPPGAYDEAPPSRAYGVVRYGYALAALPLSEVYAIVREAGFSLLGMPQQRGPIYTVAAVDQDGEDGRLVIDARSGQIIRFLPAYGLRDRRQAEIDMRYEPGSRYEPAAPPTLPQYRRPPYAAGAAAPGPTLADRTPSSVPLPKRPPARAVAAPAKPVAANVAKPAAIAPPAATPDAAPVQQSAVTAPRVIDMKRPETTGTAPPTAAPAAAPAPEATPPTVPAAPVEAKPATPEKGADAPPVQGLE
jgi:hypothetical protein